MIPGARAWPRGRPRALAFLPRFLFDAGTPPWRYVLFAWPLVALPALALAWLSAWLAPDLPGPELGPASPTLLVAVVVLISPYVETVLMSGPVMLLERWRGALVSAVGSSALWGIAHSLSAAGWGLVIWWPFLIFSIAFLTWHGRGYWRAVLIVTVLHALNNAGPIVALLVFQR